MGTVTPFPAAIPDDCMGTVSHESPEEALHAALAALAEEG